MGFLETLFCVFLVLKLVGTIDWSWWIVCSPLIFGMLLVIFVAIGRS